MKKLILRCGHCNEFDINSEKAKKCQEIAGKEYVGYCNKLYIAVSKHKTSCGTFDNIESYNFRC